jgi:multidrug efflux pump
VATGLGIGTLVTLYVVPAVYMLLARDHAATAREQVPETA